MNGPRVSTLFAHATDAPGRGRVDRLFAAAGTLAEATFPALLADHQGRVRHANAAWNALLAGLGGDLNKAAAPGLAAKISQALDTNTAQQFEIALLKNGAATSDASVPGASVPGASVPGTAFDFFLLPFPEEGVVLLLAHDVTLDRNLRDALLESRERYKALVETASDFAWETGADGKFVFVSAKGALGLDVDALLARDPASLLFDQTEMHNLPFRATRPMEEVELWFQDTEGKDICFSISCQPLFDEAGVWKGARGVCRDITEMRLHQMELTRFQNREHLLLFLVRTIRDEVDPDAMLARAAAAIAHATGADGCRIGTQAEDGTIKTGAEFGVLPAADTEKTALCDPKTTFPAVFSTPQPGLVFLTSYRGQRNGTVSLWRKARPFDKDVRDLLESVADQLGIAHEQIAVHHRLLHLSTTDALTGLLNRRAFQEKLDRRFARAAQGREKATLFYLDLDNFKQANDRHGHGTGDAALRKAGEILLQNTRSTDLVARLGGDEFALWLEDTNVTTAQKKARAILNDAVALAQFSGGEACPLNFSIGIAVFDPDHAEPLAALLSRADGAMYQAKRDGKGSYRLVGALGTQEEIAQ